MEKQNERLKNPSDWWHKFYVKDAEIYEEVLTKEEIGTLFCAVMSYRKSPMRKTEELPTSIKALYVSQCNAIDRTVKTYEEMCEKNRKNGSKGGKKKAENAKKRKEDEATKEQDEAEPANENKFEPPNKTVFKAMVKRVAHDEGHEYLDRNLFCSDEIIEELYTSLKQNNWSLNGEPFRTKGELEVYILNKLFKSDTKKYNDYSNYSNISETVLGVSEAFLESMGMEIVDCEGLKLNFDTDDVAEYFGMFFEEKGLISRGRIKKKVLEELMETYGEDTQNDEPPKTPEQPEPPKQSEEAKQNPYGGF